MTGMPLRIVIVVHVAAGLTAVVAGAAAMLSRKGPGRHPRRGTIYLGALLVVAGTATCIAIARPHTAYLLVPGAVAVTAAAIGYTARRMRRYRLHIIGMAISYLAMLTAFYVDNGPRLPLWRLLPPVTFWFLPSAIGLPVLITVLRKRAQGRLAEKPESWLLSSGGPARRSAVDAQRHGDPEVGRHASRVRRGRPVAAAEGLRREDGRR
jgi:uncharacterized membrane protein